MNIPSLHLGRGDYQHGVTLFPIWHASVASENIQSGAENTVPITELENPVVEQLQVRSITDWPVLLLDGDILVGGKQSRIGCWSGPHCSLRAALSRSRSGALNSSAGMTATVIPPAPAAPPATSVESAIKAKCGDAFIGSRKTAVPQQPPPGSKCCQDSPEC